MPCVARKTSKTHHLPLDPCVLVIIHVFVAFGADLAVYFFHSAPQIVAKSAPNATET